MNASIARIETFAINYPVRGRFKFFENRQGQPLGRPAVVVKITADNGAVGWGQSVPTPRWSYETLESVRSTITLPGPRTYRPGSVRLRTSDRNMNQAIAGSFSIGQPICKAGVELALLDLAGKLRGGCGGRWIGRRTAQNRTELDAQPAIARRAGGLGRRRRTIAVTEASI